jgi:hypothetical protein
MRTRKRIRLVHNVTLLPINQHRTALSALSRALSARNDRARSLALYKALPRDRTGYPRLRRYVADDVRAICRQGRTAGSRRQPQKEGTHEKLGFATFDDYLKASIGKDETETTQTIKARTAKERTQAAAKKATGSCKSGGATARVRMQHQGLN